jgi:alpha-L-rhamnosidase
MWDDGSRSLDHHMFGSIDQWFVEDLAGLRPTAPGYAAVRVAPHPLGDLTSASARVATVRGDVAVSWRKAAGVLSVDVTVPVGATATVVLPGVTGWRVDGGYGGVAGAPGVQSVRRDGATQVVTIGSGTYRFRGSA